MDVNGRKKELDDLDLFINDQQNVLKSVLDSLSWSEESLKNDVKVRCPINPGHWISEATLSHHKEICEWIQNGYTKEELEELPPSSAFFYEKCGNVIPVKLDPSTQVKILSEHGFINKDAAASMEFPRTVDRWTHQFTPEQRLAMYDYIIDTSKSVEKPKDVTLEDLMVDFEKKEEQDEKPKSQLEILAEMRDYKRRRQSYRAKNVHITKKSYTEIMKEVIENQTNYLVETLKSEDSEKRDNEDSNAGKRKYSYDSDDHSNPEDSSKSREHHSDHKSSSRKHKHSHHESSKHRSPKRKKHKRDRSRSKSPSHHKHKKSHKRKRSRSYD